MSAKIIQSSRAGQITTTLGPEALALLRFDGTEHVDGVFTYSVDVVADAVAHDVNDIIGTHLTVTLTSDDTGDTHFDGIVTQARWLGNVEGKATFRLRLEPWFALLRQRRNQRIWHDMTVIEILEDLLSPYGTMGQPAFKVECGNRSYEPLEYTVQYGESDFTFACRMMERFGISYFFKHKKESHTLTLVDAMSEYPKISGDIREYLDAADGHRGNKEHFWQWHAEGNMTVGAIRLTDFNFKTPTAMMEVDQKGDAQYENGLMESYDYPGKYLDENAGNTVVKLRVDQERGGDNRHRATGDVLSMRAGLQVVLGGQADPTLIKKSFLCLKASHSYVAGDVVSAGTEGGKYTGHYMLTSSDAPYAPPRVTPRAIVHGPQTAWVIGPAGEEIHCDEYGRIKVRFHWDLDGAHSMWCRVSQNWSGNGWGGMVIPRIGMEVMVEHLEGDPDKPLVTGCVYNGKNAVPYSLPDNKTVSTFKTDTHQGEGFNELRFEDKKDAEEIFMHGQKDLNVKIENNATERVNVNKVESVGNNRATETHNNETNVIGGDLDIFVGPGQRGRHTPGSATEEAQGIGGEGYGLGARGSSEGTGNLMLTVEESRSEEIGKNDTLNVGKNKSETIGNNHDITVGNNFVLDVGNKITIKCGQSMMTMDSRGNIAVNGNKIDLTANQLIKLAASMIKLN